MFPFRFMPFSSAPMLVDRRSFLRATSALASAVLLSPKTWAGVIRNPKLPDYPFQLGVASGDPTPDGVVLWTRLAPKPLEVGGGMPMEPIEVSWEIAEDESMR